MRLLRYFLFLFVFLFLFLGYFHPIDALNQDLGRHLLTGKIIVQTQHVPTTNLFSYTYPTFPFINHHWFSEVIFYLVFTATGYPGLFILSLLLIGSAFGLVFLKASRGSSPFALAFLSIIYLRILFERTDLRPELFSFLLLAAFITILYTYREKFTRLIYLLIPLELLWANMHIYFPIGILCLVLFTGDAAITHRRNLKSYHFLTLLAVTAASSLITLLNPNGPQGALYPLRVFQNYGYTIEENQTPFFLQSLGFYKPSFPYLEIAIAVLFISLLATVKKSRVIDWLLGIIFSFIALSAVRNFPLFVFATLIPASRALSQLVALLPRPQSERSKTLSTAILTIGFLLLVLWQMSIISTKPRGYGVYEDGKQAITFFEEQRLKGPIFNNFDIGSYIESRLYPRERVFIDGRPEAYPASFIQNVYIPMQQDMRLFQKVAQQYKFNTIIFSHTDQTPWAEQFLKEIVRNPDWVSIYLDPMMIILVKNTPQNEEVMKRFGRSSPEFSLPRVSNKQELSQIGHFFSIIGHEKALKTTLLELLKLDPNNCNALRILASFYLKENNPASSIYLHRYQTSCQ